MHVVEYRELDKPKRLVYLQQLCDEHWVPARHPLLPAFPGALLVQVELQSVDGQSSCVTVHMIPFGECTAEGRAAFNELRPSMTQGWNQAFDKLESMQYQLQTQSTE